MPGIDRNQRLKRFKRSRRDVDTGGSLGELSDSTAVF